MILAMSKLYALFCVLLMSVGVGVAGASPASAPLSVPSDEMTKLLTHLEEPVYPSSAKSAGITGIVVLNVVVDSAGKVESDTVVSGPSAFTGSAVSAVNSWIYKPYLVNGSAVKVQTLVTVTYSLGK